MNITTYSVIIFFDTFLIHEIKTYFEAFRGNLVPRKFLTIWYTIQLKGCKHNKKSFCIIYAYIARYV